MTDLGIRNRFDRACQLKNDGQSELAIEEFECLLRELPESAEKWVAGTHGVLGDIYLSDLSDFESAETHFRLALRLRPQAEHASTGLYSALLAQEKEELAYREMIRLLAHGRCGGYEKELEDLEPCARLVPLVDAARALSNANRDVMSEDD